MTGEPSRAVRLCGTEETDPPARRLSAGPLSVLLENGQLRYVSFAGKEVLRGIAFLVRDENWGTYRATLSGLAVEEKPEGFTVTYRALCADARQRLAYGARIAGRSDGSLSFEAVAEPETDVITNRTGFVVLHPAGLAGRPVTVTHVDGREVEARFPEHISPSQPIFDIRALGHEVAPGLRATCRMEGDSFEMEDQRNWGDASYKTYVRPLALPWGYKLAKGSRHEQAIRLSFSGRPPAAGVAAPGGIAVTLGGDLPGRMPEIGVGLPAGEAAHALAAVERLRKLGPKFLVCNIDLRDGRGLGELTTYRRAAEAAGAAIVMEIVVPDEADAAAALAPAAEAMATAGLMPQAVAISSAADLKSWQPGAERPETPSVEAIAKAARAAFPGARLGGGMLSYFTELNRKRPKPALFDYFTHTTCAVVHAADDRSVMETLETLPAIIASTRAMIAGKPYRIGPSAIAARDNPYGKGVAANPDNGRVCLSNIDPRPRALFGAAWTLGYAAAAARGGVEALALGAVTGPFGVIHRKAGYAQPHFDALSGPAVYPAFHVMAGLARGSGCVLVEAGSSDPGSVAALAWRAEDRAVLWLANLTAAPIAVRLAGLPPGGRRLSMLDAACFERAAGETGALDSLARPLPAGALVLDAYAVARID